MRIGLLSDTHGFLDDDLLAHLEPCDEVWHAGDFGSVDVLDRLRALRTTRGVYGNVDGTELRLDLPRDLAWDCDGLSVYMTHIDDARARRELHKLRPRLFICGHSHILKVARDPARGLLHMNPGACGRNGWHLMRTILRFTVNEGKISEVEAIELGPRGRNASQPAY